MCSLHCHSCLSLYTIRQTSLEVHLKPSAYVQLLGIKASKRDIKEMLSNAGADDSGEIGYDAFVQIMTTQLLSAKPAQPSNHPAQDTNNHVAVLSFDTIISEYRR